MKNILIAAFLLIAIASCDVASKSREADKARDSEKITSNDTVNNQADEEETPNPYVRTPEEDSIEEASNAEGNRQIVVFNYNKGVEFYQKGDMKKALEKFKMALERKPDDSRINNYMARIYYDMGQKELAISYYEDAVRYDSQDSVSILGIGQIHFDMGDYVKAMEYYNKAIEVAPAYGLAYYNRGTLKGMQNQYYEALEDLNISIKYDPQNGNAYVNRGLAHYFLKALNSACQDWQKAADMGMEKGAEAVELYCK